MPSQIPTKQTMAHTAQQPFDVPNEPLQGDEDDRFFYVKLVVLALGWATATAAVLVVLAAILAELYARL